MSKAHKGFVDNSGVQSHSAGDLFPYSIVCIGGFPAADNNAYCEVWGPEGRRDGPFREHSAAEEWAAFLKRSPSWANAVRAWGFIGYKE